MTKVEALSRAFDNESKSMVVYLGMLVDIQIHEGPICEDRKNV